MIRPIIVIFRRNRTIRDPPVCEKKVGLQKQDHFLKRAPTFCLGLQWREARFVARAIFICLLLLSSMTLKAASAQQDQVTVYLRGDIKNAKPSIATINGVYDLNTAWGTLESAARVGTYSDQFGTWGYKLEALTPEFSGKHRFAVRVVKDNDYQQSGTTQSTYFAERFIGSYKPLASSGFMEDAGVNLELGTAQSFMNAAGNNVLPKTFGSMNLIPLWALKLKLPETGTTRHYVLSYSDFDVFDPYPASQPFVQAEVTQKLNQVTYYSYVRYRWDYSVTQFYSLYLAIGAEFPN